MREALAGADLVLASCLTLIECDRTLIRAVVTKELPEAIGAGRRAVLGSTSNHWILFGLDAETIERSRERFPGEPIRTLDAVHLATAVSARSLVPDMAVLSLDERVRRSARQMGFEVLPQPHA